MVIICLGSGAPFHFHCNALNALVYGRKRLIQLGACIMI